jgi:hypothetical protein
MARTKTQTNGTTATATNGKQMPQEEVIGKVQALLARQLHSNANELQ